MIGVGAKRKGRRDGALVRMVRVGCGGAVVLCGRVRVAGGAPWEVRAGGGGVWVVRVGSDEGVDGGVGGGEGT